MSIVTYPASEPVPSSPENDAAAIVFRFANSQTQILQLLHLRKPQITALKSALTKTKTKTKNL